MRVVFGILALVVVLAVVGSLARKQLQALNGGGATREAAAASAAGIPGAVADPNAATPAQQSRSLQEKARTDTVRALEQGADRNRRAEP